MKVELQCGDTITIPEGCKATIKDGSVVFEKEEKKENRKKNFKEGDVLHSKTDDTMLIFKEVCNYDREVFDSHCNTSRRDNKRWNINAFRYATEEEKTHFFDMMKENGYRWNADDKRVESIWWRAKCGEKYFVVRMDGGIHSFEECNDDSDNSFYKVFNYFRTEEQDREAARRVKETLRKYHEEIGE